MLDIQFIRDNPDLVKQKSAQKNEQVDIDTLLKLDTERRGLEEQINKLRESRNTHSALGADKQPDANTIAAGKQIKQKLVELEEKLRPVNEEFEILLKAVPNMPLDFVPVGKTEDDNTVIREWGTKPNFDFHPLNHVELGNMRDLIDKERATKVAGSRFAYIKGGLVQLQFALIQWTLSMLADPQVINKLIKKNSLKLSDKPFVPVLPPAVVNTTAYEATARLNAEDTTYKLADNDMWLNASAEHSLCNMYMGEILPEAELPIRYIGYATSFRREAGTYGKDTEGIIRMHQFDKLEMEVFSSSQTALDEHKLLVALQEHMVQQLELPYQVLQKCTADIGKPNAAGVDINIWMPGQDKYRETHTADYMTDYQARRLKTRLRRVHGETEFVHTNDATAFAMGRTLVAIMENNQTKDGLISVPEVLRPFMGGRLII